MFCGPNQTAYSVEDGILYNECFVDGLTLIPYVCFIAVAVPILVILAKSRDYKVTTWVHYQGHIFRWIFTLGLILVNIFEIGEGLISFLEADSKPLHLLVPQCVSLVANILTLVYYHNIETWNAPKFLLLLLAYWICALVVKSLEVTVLFNYGLNIPHIRFDLTWDCIIAYFLLLVVELNVLRLQKYAFFKQPRLLSPPEELQNTKYYQSYANFLSCATYWWVNSLLVKGYKAALEIYDLGRLPQSEWAETSHKKLNDGYQEEKKKASLKGKKPSLWIAYGKATFGMMYLSGLYKLLGELLAFVGPYCINGIVTYVIKQNENTTTAASNATAPEAYKPHSLYPGTNMEPSDYIGLGDMLENGYFLCILLLVSAVTQHTFLQNHHYLVIREGIRIRAGLQTMIYDKTMKLSSWAMSGGSMTVGQIVNHMSTDATQVMVMFYLIHYVWAMPITVIIAMVMLHATLGYCAIIGGMVIVLMVPVQYKLAALLAGAQHKTLQHADDRIKLCNELLQGMKLLKLYGWEDLFGQGVEKSRNKELKALLIAAVYRSITLFVTNAAPVLVTLIAFILYPVLENEPLTAAKAFSSLALFNMLNLPLFLFPMVMNNIVKAKVSTDRISNYLNAPEIDNSSLPECLPCFLKTGVTTPPRSRHASSTRGDAAPEGLEPPVMRQTSRQSSSSLEDEEEPERDCCNVVEIKDGVFSWNFDTQEPTLSDINLSIKSGQLTMVVGSVGSGKSSLMSAMLGEMCTVKGCFIWNKDMTLAYAAQKPWLLNATLRDNITFGQPYDKHRYSKVIKACALQPDIDILPGGDQTEIGEKGINLSGGQKQRISVARAIYSTADVVILDDPLSALDVHVGNHLFKEGIIKQLLKKGRTVILVTHQLQHLGQANKIIVMDNGRILEQGTLEEIQEKDPTLYDTWKQTIGKTKSHDNQVDGGDHHNDHQDKEQIKQIKIQSKKSSTGSRERVHNDENAVEITDQVASERIFLQRQCSKPCIKNASEAACHVDMGKRHWLQTQFSIASDPDLCETLMTQMSIISDVEDDVDFNMMDLVLAAETGSMMQDEKRDVEEPLVPQEKGKLTMAEEREKGHVKFKVYLSYAAACGTLFASLILLMFFLRQGADMGKDFWLADWSTHSEAQPTSTMTNSTVPADDKVDYYVTGYALWSVASIILAMLSVTSTELAGLKAAQHLHQGMLSNIILAPMRFFDITPTGRILNRFSADANVIDQTMSFTIGSVLRLCLQCLGATVIICITTPWFLIAVVPIAVFYYFLQKFYRASSREIQRLDSISKSPIFAHFSETLGGLATIRAYRDEIRFRKHILASIDTNNCAYLWINTANRWLGIRLDYLGALIVFLAAISAMSAGLAGSTDPGLVGLAITYALQVANLLNWVVRSIADMEMQMNAVERVVHYTKVQNEPYELDSDKKAPSDWLKAGSIQFEDVTLAYAKELDPVLKNVNLNIKAGEKIGICGRTGSGKSSLTLGLFRIIHLASGKISIDGQDISELPLRTLRSRLAIIPQDPVLFAGTIRYNLDPQNQKSDDQLWKALEISQLKSVINELPNKLDDMVSEGGENFSLGQRQLFCLARAFLRNSNILVMDEATASVDMDTDATIQQVIAEVFKDTTVLIIAHRISTILNCDKIVVLEQGEVMEQDSPSALLNKEDSLFVQLVKASDK